MNMRSKVAAAAATVAIVATAALPAHAIETPTYVEAVASGVSLKVLSTAGDSINGYQIAGVPDGTGAFKSGSSVKLLMNHELS
jgi:hypothetical protein